MALDAFGVKVFMVRPTAVELLVVTGGDQVGYGPFLLELFIVGWLVCSHRTVLRALFRMRRP